MELIAIVDFINGDIDSIAYRIEATDADSAYALIAQATPGFDTITFIHPDDPEYAAIDQAQIQPW